MPLYNNYPEFTQAHCCVLDNFFWKMILSRDEPKKIPFPLRKCSKSQNGDQNRIYPLLSEEGYIQCLMFYMRGYIVVLLASRIVYHIIIEECCVMNNTTSVASRIVHHKIIEECCIYSK